MNDPRPARPGDVEAIALVLADAFFDDPGAAIFEPKPVRDGVPVYALVRPPSG